jgi:hypothetical protein
MQPHNYAILALHFERSGQVRKHLFYTIAAAADANDRFAVGQAVAFYTKVTEVIATEKEVRGIEKPKNDNSKAHKKNQVTAEPSQEPDIESDEWLLSQDIAVIRQLSSGHVQVRNCFGN